MKGRRRAATIEAYRNVLASFGEMSEADASVHAQVLPQDQRKAFIQAGLLRVRRGTPLVQWTLSGIAACVEANRKSR